MNPKSPPLPQAERLALGKRIHEKEWTNMKAASAALGRHEASLYTYLKDYRATIGVVTPSANAAGHEAERKARDAERHRQNRAAKKAAKANGNGALAHVNGNGSGNHLVPLEHDSVLKLKDRIRDLEAELAHVQGEAHTLQKIVMVLGERL